jgi:hypothetical protein
MSDYGVRLSVANELLREFQSQLEQLAEAKASLAAISDDLAIWTLPGERTKNGAVHAVPLSAAARDLIWAASSPEAL